MTELAFNATLPCAAASRLTSETAPLQNAAIHLTTAVVYSLASSTLVLMVAFARVI